MNVFLKHETPRLTIPYRWLAINAVEKCDSACDSGLAKCTVEVISIAMTRCRCSCVQSLFHDVYKASWIIRSGDNQVY